MGTDFVLAAQDARRRYATPAPSSYRTINGLEKVLGWWDASTLTGANASAVSLWPDSSGQGQDLINPTSGATQPTLTTNSLGGKPTIALGATSYLVRALFGNNWGQPAGFAQPISIIMLARVASAGSRSANGFLTGFNSPAATNRLSLFVDTTGTLGLFGSSAGAIGGAPVNDDTWHTFAGIFDTASSTVFVDGTITGTLSTQAHGSNVLGGFSVGAVADGSSPVGLGDLAEVIVCQSRLSPQLIAQAAAALAAKWSY